MRSRITYAAQHLSENEVHERLQREQRPGVVGAGSPFAWITQCRRLSLDSEAMIYIAMTRLMVRRLAAA